MMGKKEKHAQMVLCSAVVCRLRLVCYQGFAVAWRLVSSVPVDPMEIVRSSDSCPSSWGVFPYSMGDLQDPTDGGT